MDGDEKSVSEKIKDQQGCSTNIVVNATFSRGNSPRKNSIETINDKQSIVSNMINSSAIQQTYNFLNSPNPEKKRMQNETGSKYFFTPNNYDNISMHSQVFPSTSYTANLVQSSDKALNYRYNPNFNLNLMSSPEKKNLTVTHTNKPKLNDQMLEEYNLQMNEVRKK
jgi:hypothetical protein